MNKKPGRGENSAARWEEETRRNRVSLAKFVGSPPRTCIPVILRAGSLGLQPKVCPKDLAEAPHPRCGVSDQQEAAAQTGVEPVY